MKSMSNHTYDNVSDNDVWKAVRKYINENKDATWKGMIMDCNQGNLTGINAERLMQARDNLVTESLKKASTSTSTSTCRPKTPRTPRIEDCACVINRVGSRSQKSDFDCFEQNRIRARSAKALMLRTVFGNNNDECDVDRLMKVLDVNIYTSNFELVVCAKVDQSRFIVYQQGEQNKNLYISSNTNSLQRTYAFYALLNYRTTIQSHLDGNVHTPVFAMIITQLQALRNVLNSKEGIIRTCQVRRERDDCLWGRYDDFRKLADDECVTEREDRKPIHENDINDFVNEVSFLSTQQNDAYVTQGSYMRWVLGIKDLKPYLLKDSIIEQLCMAYKAAFREVGDSCIKYLARAATDLSSAPFNLISWKNLENTVPGRPEPRPLKTYADYLTKKDSDPDSPEFHNLERTLINDIQNHFGNVAQGILEIIENFANAQVRGDYPSQQHGAAKRGTQQFIKKIHLHGRIRNVYKIGRAHYVTYKGVLLPLKQAKKLPHS